MSATHAISAGRVGTLRNPDMWLVSPKYDLVLIIVPSTLSYYGIVDRHGG